MLQTLPLSGNEFHSVNKTLWERIFGRGCTTGIIRRILVIPERTVRYVIREDKSVSLLLCSLIELIQYVPIENKNQVISL